MSHHSRNAICIKLTCLIMVCVLAVAGAVFAADAPASASHASTAPTMREYSVINLGPTGTRALVNQRGEVAFVAPEPDAAGDTRSHLRVFDGRRIREHGAFAEDTIHLSDFNELGTVVGRLVAPTFPFDTRAFQWTRARGVRMLPSPGTSGANAVNNQDRTVGWLSAGETEARAVLWSSGGGRTYLGPLPAWRSEAFAINQSGLSAGVADGATDGTRATLWRPDGRGIDLGMVPLGQDASARYINARGDVAGRVQRRTQLIGFFWSRESGMVPVAPVEAYSVYMAALNDRSEVAGNLLTSDGQGFFTPFIWSLRDGLRQLSLAGAPSGYLYDLNSRGDMVGDIQLSPQDRSARRAMLWRGVAAPVDLTTRLYRAPAGLVLASATALNDRGDILANSNAGVLLLRPGRQGAAAPVLGPVTGLPPYGQVPTGSTLDLALAFVDDVIGETHVASARVTDGCPHAAPSVREIRGAGDVSLRHTFCRAGSFALTITLTDSAGNATRVVQWVGVGNSAVARE
jgi:hypothetical protein